MPILLGVCAALLIGVSDTFGRASARRANAVSHVSTQMLVGVAVALPLSLVITGSFLWDDVLSGLAGGVMIAFGLSFVYRGMAEASSAIVSPLAAILGAVIPLMWDLIGGASLSLLQSMGCGIALLSLALTTFSRAPVGDIRAGLILAIAGGVFFGLSIVLSVDTSEASGAWPATSQRFGGFVAMAVLATRQSIPIFLPPAVRKFGVLGGISGAFGMVCWIIGGQQGDLGTVSVISATYPAVVVVLATLFDDDEIRWWQAIGVASAIAGTILIALG